MDKDEKEILGEELKQLKALQSVAHLEGVKMLIDSSKNTVMSCIETLSTQYFEKGEQELRALCATLKANLELYQSMTGLDEKIKAIEEVLK